VAALPLPLQDFHLLAFASFAGRTHQYDRLNVPWGYKKDVVLLWYPLGGRTGVLMVFSFAKKRSILIVPKTFVNAVRYKDFRLSVVVISSFTL
jgi:hypothetical protein